jgi:serine protease
MKRITLGALVVLLTVAAAAEETQRYLVATRRPVRELAVGSLSREIRERDDRRVTAFEHVFTGYSAELTASEAAALRSSPDVRYVEPVVERHLMAEETVPGAQFIPLGIQTVRAPQAWVGTRSAVINVAVIDSGVDHRHPELASAWAGGYNVLTATAGEAMDGLGHGTHVAGIIAAGNNEFGVVGVAPNVRLWGVRAIDNTGEGTMDNVIKGLDWIVAKAQQEGGRWVVNLSLGGREASTGEREAFENAVDKGLILVAAAGNDSYASGPATVSYPAAYNGVLGVAALDERNEHAPFSNSGPEVDFAAPGVKVLSTDLFGYDFLSYIRSNDEVFSTRPLEGSKDGTVNGEYVYCSLGSEADFAATNVRGKIALMKRGGDTFANKVRRANEAGALGVIVFNNDGSSDRWTLVSDEDPWSKTYVWPVAVALSKEIGEMLAERGSGPMKIARDSNDFSRRTGTSMATPHVTGAIALLWSLAPNATSAQIYQAIAATARDIGDAGKDNFNGHGLIDVNAAARRLAPGAFGDGPVDDGRSGRRLGRRTRR